MCAWHHYDNKVRRFERRAASRGPRPACSHFNPLAHCQSRTSGRASWTKHRLTEGLAHDIGEDRAHALVAVLADLLHDLLEPRLRNARARGLADEVVEALL